jgi:UDP-N-acetylmuramyl pentapeptide synthase
LGFLAQKVIQKYKPFIIGITGTVGKTTTSHYIADFLERQFPGQTYISPFSYNGEF